MARTETNGEKIRRINWSSIAEFIGEQTEIEKEGYRKKRKIWGRADDSRMFAFRKRLEILQVESSMDPEKLPKCDPDFAKFYNHLVTKKVWRMQLYVNAAGEVELRHNQVADSIRTWVEAPGKEDKEFHDEG